MRQGSSVYIASPKGYAKEVSKVAEDLNRLGYLVVSTWHKNVLPDDSDVTDLELLWIQNMRELCSADAMLLLHYPGGREMYVELGRMLAMHRQVIIYQPGKEPLPLSHVCTPRLAHVVFSLDRAYRMLEEYKPRVTLYSVDTDSFYPWQGRRDEKRG